MSSKTEIKHQAQDEILDSIASLIASHQEGTYGVPDEEIIEALRKQAKRVMKMFSVEEFPGI